MLQCGEVNRLPKTAVVELDPAGTVLTAGHRTRGRLTREFCRDGDSPRRRLHPSTTVAFFTISKVSLRVLTGLPARLRSMHDTSDRSPRRLRTLARPAAVLLMGGLAILFTACGGGSSASTTSTAAGSSSNAGNNKPSGSSSFTAYRNCLSQHGVTLPNFSRGNGAPPGGGGYPGGGAPGGSGTGTPGRGGFGGFANNPKYQAAAKACASLRPKGGFGGFGRGGGFNSAAGAAYRNCLKLHGVTLPTRGSTSSGSPSSTISSSTFRAAAAACAALRPTPTTSPSSAG